MSTLSSLKKIRNGFVAEMDKVIFEISAKSKKKFVGTKVTKSTEGKMLKNGVNKSAEIRKFIQENPECLNKEVVSGLKEKMKIEVNPSHVSIIRKKMENNQEVKKVVAKRKKKKVQEAKIVAKRKVENKADLSDLPMTSLCAKILGNNKNGLKLKQIAEIVQSSGYHYEGEKGFDGIRQNVYQALNNLSKTRKHRGYEGSYPVVLKDKEKHLYLLNPKAKIA